MLNKILKDKGIRFKRNIRWVLHSQYSDKGLTEIKQQKLPKGIVIYDRNLTGKGRDFILNLLTSE